MNEIINNKIKKLLNHFQSANYEYVIRECKTILKKFPESPAILNMLGLSLQQIGNYEDAKTYYLKTIQLNPQHYAALNNLGIVCKTMEDFKNSEKYFLKALKLKPDYINALSNYANLKREINDFDEAINLYTKALEVDQNEFLIHHNLALAYQGIGKFDLAKKHTLKSLEINPNHAISHKMLSTSNKYKDENDNHFKLMKDKLKDENLTKDSKITLNFSISKAYEDMSNFDNAFNHMLIGNDLNRSKIKYNIEKDIELFRQIKDKFSAFDFNKKNNENFESKKIIFICGMPRSGTTLTEQIIASHKNVYGAGELNHLTKTIKNNFFKKEFLSDKELSQVSNNQISSVYNEYISFLDTYKFQETTITDKAPLNFRWIGFIKIFFPNSKIIHCKRNNKDNFLSLYKNLFDGDNLNWCYDQKELTSYYNLYSDLMDFWEKKIPGFIYQARYESIVKNQEEESRRMIKFCELDWDPNCLNFYKNNKTPIKTASIVQARKPIYKSSLLLSDKYSKYFQKSFSLLG
jgi:tetratricopeptide (TPR) repeat protein